MAVSVTLPAPAKINWFLRILARRSDGFHQLQTAFSFVDWCDTLHFTLRDDGNIHLHTAADMGPVQDNLIIKAARLLQKTAGDNGRVRGCDIHCDKHLPIGAGLGGGSSNAATTLLALNHLWHCQLDKPALLALAGRLGADVPIFVHGHACWAEGIGDVFSPLPDDSPAGSPPGSYWWLILNPQVVVATAAIFQHADCLRNQAPLVRGALPVEHTNDCQPLVTSLYPEIGRALAWLSARHFAWLTGTGCAIVSCFKTRAAAERVAEQVPPPWCAEIARHCPVSPLLSALNAL